MKKGQRPGYTESTHVSPCSSRKEGRKEKGEKIRGRKIKKRKIGETN